MEEPGTEQLGKDITIVTRAARRTAENFARNDQAKIAKAIHESISRVEAAFLRDTLNKKKVFYE